MFLAGWWKININVKKSCVFFRRVCDVSMAVTAKIPAAEKRKNDRNFKSFVNSADSKHIRICST